MSRKSSLSRRTGSYGRRKYGVFTVLDGPAFKRGRDGYLSTRELAIYSGVPYRSLTRCLPQWVEWGYVERRPARSIRRHIGDYEYKLLVHGESWLKLANDKLHNSRKFYDELRSWYVFAVKNFDLLAKCKFNKLLDLLSVVRTKIPAPALSTVKITYDARSKHYDVEYDEDMS